METTTSSRKFIDLSLLPKEYEHQKQESLWKEMWEKIGIYSFKNDKPRDQTFVIDTPPPTVSGTLHIGHLFSYTHTDLIARFQRMQGKDIFYPMGFDDNGLPTERRVQNYFNVNCDATLPYDPSFKREKQEDQPIKAISRQNFIELCNQLTQEDEKAFLDLWKRLGLSVDWNLQYATIDSHSRKTAQISFLDLIQKDRIYSSEYPVMWDIDFKTSVAQAECEDREIPATMHEIQFKIFSEENSNNLETFTIGTTRPELLPACIAIVINPDDERHKHLKGKQALTPLFHTKVPILTSPLVSLEKGTGIVMVCTFGDQTDIIWWQEFKLPLRQIIGKDGKLSPIQFSSSGLFTSTAPEIANQNYEKIKGCIIPKARKILVDLLKQEGILKSTSTFMHQVKFFEKGNSPLEFLSTRQWYVKIMDKKKEMIEMGAKITWYPEFMVKKFNDWTEHLKFDWCISRQRYFGVPFPLWYPLDSHGNPDFSKPIYPNLDMLPIDPTIHTPPGFKNEQRNQPNGFTSEDCVFDTWFTSSLTPQIMSGWHKNKDLHEKIFPMDLRPQSHEIIRTWTFYTVAKALFHENKLPWTTVAISGWVLDPDRKKMSKSKGNVMTPLPIIQEFSADGARYWAALAKLGSDTAFDKSVFQNGKRLVLKLFNAAKFIFSQSTSEDLKITQDLDLSFLSQLKSVVKEATDAFKNNEYSVALATTEFFFYHGLTDNYIELIRDRLKNSNSSIEKSSAVNTLRFSISILLRLFAPFLPYITEEIWSWILREETKIQSIHIANWPSESEFDDIPQRKGDLFATAVLCLEEIRKIKGKEKMKALQHFASLEMAVPEKLYEDTKNVLEPVMKAMLVDKWDLAKTEGEFKILTYQPKV